MNSATRTSENLDPRAQEPRLGTRGALAIFAWYLGSVFILPLGPMVLLSVLGMGIGWIWFRESLRRLFRWRVLLFLVFLFLPPALWIGSPDQSLLGVGYSSEGLQFGLLMSVRAIAMLTVILWFTQSVEITELAGLLERAGLHGIGFSMGVAVNFLPTLMRSAQNAWHTLKMRGGLRRNWRQSLQLFSVTVIANALRRSEEIALSAEARGFTPGQSVSLPLRRGSWDAQILVLALISWLLIVILR